MHYRGVHGAPQIIVGVAVLAPLIYRQLRARPVNASGLGVQRKVVCRRPQRSASQSVQNPDWLGTLGA